ncbi:hypothetical protein LguiB_019446 [Lonicera macranthoides]
MVFRSKSHFKRMNRKEQTEGGRFQHPPVSNQNEECPKAVKQFEKEQRILCFLFQRERKEKSTRKNWADILF